VAEARGCEPSTEENGRQRDTFTQRYTSRMTSAMCNAMLCSPTRVQIGGRLPLSFVSLFFFFQLTFSVYYQQRNGMSRLYCLV
jgi:hypothetical protein